MKRIWRAGQYDAVDPADRLVAGELECRWNARLADVRQQEENLEGLTAARPEALSEAEHERLLALGADLETAWTHSERDRADAQAYRAGRARRGRRQARR